MQNHSRKYFFFFFFHAMCNKTSFPIQVYRASLRSKTQMPNLMDIYKSDKNILNSIILKKSKVWKEYLVPNVHSYTSVHL